MSASAKAQAVCQAIRLIDHTSLNLDDTEYVIKALLKSGISAFPHVPALCVYPKFVPFLRAIKAHEKLRIATVVNFPLGNSPLAEVVEETARTVRDGVDEVDLVIDYRLLMENKRQGEAAAFDLVSAVRVVCPVGEVVLKVIIESGALASPDLILSACMAALKGGCDFLKTSTGKVPVNATLEAAATMMTAIRCFESLHPSRRCGFKAAGGVKSAEQCLQFIELAESIMGKGWVTPQTFRFGASTLLGVLLNDLRTLVPSACIPLVDHTLLRDDDTQDSVNAFVEKAMLRPNAQRPGAFCIFSQFVSAVKTRHPGCLVATVVNFPKGLGSTAEVVEEAAAALSNGADEVDLVINYKKVRADADAGAAEAENLVKAVKAVCADAPLKVIIESGELKSRHLISVACMAALKGGCDFLKTSTGKVPMNATPEAVETMVTCAEAHLLLTGKRCGIKVAGGVKTQEQAMLYIDLVQRFAGKLEISADDFRFGSSSLLDVLINTDPSAVVSTSGY